MLRKKINYKKVLVTLLFFFALTGTIFYIQRPRVVNFTNSSRQHAFINKMFDEDWYWLVAGSREDFSPDYMMDNRASSKNPEEVNNLQIKVYNEWGNRPVGFAVYHGPYLGEPKHARLLFLAVDSSKRGYGYGYKLAKYALKDLKAQGYKSVELITRINNISAQKLYKRLGFHEFYRDNTFVRFRKLLL